MRKLSIVAAFLFVVTAAHAQTPEAVWHELMAGNEKFVAGNLDFCALKQLRTANTRGQFSPASILSCADSRVPAELVFDRTIGELFTVRVAGNVDDTFGVASLQYAVLNRWTKVIVVMGHRDCGAVKAALHEPERGKPTPELYDLILRIRKSFTTPEPDLHDATIMNINYTAAQLEKDPTLKGVTIIKAYYDVATGKVERIP